jgi:hypothetical protein
MALMTSSPRSSVACALALAAVGLLLAPSGAEAQGLTFSPPAEPEHAYRLTLRWDTVAFGETVSIFAGDRTTLTSWTNVLAAQLDMGSAVLRLAVPLAYLRSSSTGGVVGPRSSDQAELGNLELEALADLELGGEHRLLIGGGVALPTATDQRTESDLGGFLIRTLSWAASFRNYPAWADQSFTVWPTAEYRFASEWVLFSAAGAMPILFPTSSRVGGGPLARGNVEVMLTLDVAVAVRILEIVDVGASFLGWALPSGAGYDPDGIGPRETPDLGQTAVTLFVRTDEALDLPVGGGFEMILNLDESWGPTGDEGKFWGARIFLTGTIDG